MGVEFFDTAGAAGDAVTEALEAADARAVEWQTELKPGDCFMCDSGEGFPLFGELLESYSEERLRHCRLCKCYSVVCPQGELGGVHVSTIRCIVSRGLFERLRAQGWQF